MKNVIILLFLCIITSCNKKKSQESTVTTEKKVTIRGEINEHKTASSTISGTIVLKNYLNSSREYLKFPIDSLGNFKYEFMIDHPTDIGIFTDNINHYSLIVHPGDKITVSLDNIEDQSEFLKNIKLIGDHANLNTAYLDYLSEIELINNTYENDSRNKTITLEALKKRFDSLDIVKEKTINKYINENTDKPALTNWLNAEKLIYERLKLLQIHSSIVSDNTTKLSEGFDKNIEPSEKISESLLINSNLSEKYINEYLTHIRYDIVEKNPEISKTWNTFNPVYLKTIIERNKDNPLLAQLAISNLSHRHLEQMNISFYENNRVIIDSILQKTLFENPLTDNYIAVKELIENPILSENIKLLDFNTENPKEFLNEIIENANGKVIYIDNWTTWCKPCKIHFKNSIPQLKKEFHKDVEFVYLCHGSGKESWKATIAKYNIKGKHYFLSQEERNSITKDLSIRRVYPTYSIINKNGKVVTSNFKNLPDDENTHETLKRLIAE